MVSRYDNVDVFINSDRVYRNILGDRGITQVQQYGTRNLMYPTRPQLRELNIIAHTWRYGDRYYNLAHEHFGDAKMWWVIAFFNQKPTEAELRFGDTVYIPHPIERVLNFYGA
jgi:hypothetical protein